MVDEVRKITVQQFSQTGMKLSDIKQNNELLFNYFTKAGYKEEAVIYSSDIEKVTQQFDTDKDGKLSQKELKTMLGEDVSRSERRAARKALNAIKTNDLSSNEELMSETIDEHTTNYRNNKGDIVYTESTDEDGSTKTYPFNGSDSKIAKRERTEKSLPGVVTTTEYLDGESTMPSKEVVNDNGDITTTEYKYDGASLHTTEEVHGNDITFKKYRNGSDGFPEPTLTMEYKKGSQEQFRSYENKFDDKGRRTAIVIENTGSYVKDNGGVLKEEITLTPEGYEISSHQVKGIPDKFIQAKTVTVQKDNNTEEVQYFKNFGGKQHRIEKAKDGTEFLNVKMPEGWSVERLAKEFGVTKEALLDANKASDGSARYLTNSNGVSYFLADQSVKINNPTKLPAELAEDKYLYGEDTSKALQPKKHVSGHTNAGGRVSKKRGNRAANGVLIPANMQLVKNDNGTYTGQIHTKAGEETYNLDAKRNVVNHITQKGNGQNRIVTQVDYNAATGQAVQKTVRKGNKPISTFKYTYSGRNLVRVDTAKVVKGGVEKSRTLYSGNKKTESVSWVGKEQTSKSTYWRNGKIMTATTKTGGLNVETRFDEHGVKRYSCYQKPGSNQRAEYFYDQNGKQIDVDPKKININRYISNIATAYRSGNRDGSISIS